MLQYLKSFDERADIMLELIEKITIEKNRNESTILKNPEKSVSCITIVE